MEDNIVMLYYMYLGNYFACSRFAYETIHCADLKTSVRVSKLALLFESESVEFSRMNNTARAHDQCLRCHCARWRECFHCHDGWNSINIVG